MPRPPVPLDGPYHHEETPRKDIAATKVKMAKVRYLMTEIKQNARAGSDDAAEVGYNQETHNEVLMMAKECQIIIDESRVVQAEVDETIETVRELERINATQSPVAEDPELRRRAAAQVFKFITDSLTGFHTLLRAIGIQVTPEIRTAVDESLAQATDSQTERWIRGAQQTPRVLVLQRTLEQKESELSALKLDLERQKTIAFQYQRDRHQTETNLVAERAKIVSH
jgi:SMC interacting uncharacterized protein involved in chromosome segregation